MRILITNDDGINAPGIAALTRATSKWIERCPEGEIREAIIVAPDKNYSGMSSAVGDVFDHPSVKYKKQMIEGADNIQGYALDAPPALCAILGAVGSFNFQPDLILSGINAGANVGRSVLHSGTVGAILTGAQLGLSGLAVSTNWGENVSYEPAADIAIEVLEVMLQAPQRTLMNLNVPNLPRNEIKGVKRGRISTAGIVKSAKSGTGGPLDDEGELKLRLGAATPELGDVSDEDADEDGALIAAGYASLTPLRGPHEDSDMGLSDLMHMSLSVIERHLKEAN